MSAYQGRYAEQIFIVEAMKRGLHIYKPVCDVNGIDFIIQLRKKLIKIQVKSTSVEKSNRPNTYQVCVRKGYDCTHYTDEFNYLAAFIIPLNTFYIIPIKELNKTTIGINPNSNKCKFFKYKEAWNLIY